jgi:SulP family sulfate permease
VVIIRLRDRDEVGSTFIRIIERYTRGLKAQGNLIMLTGLNKHVLEQLEKTDLIDLIGEENLFPAEARFGASGKRAIQTAEAWMSQGKQV